MNFKQLTNSGHVSSIQYGPAHLPIQWDIMSIQIMWVSVDPSQYHGIIILISAIITTSNDMLI